MKGELFLKDGWFTKIGSFLCLVLGLAIVGLVIWLEPPKVIYIVLLITGLIFIGFAGIEARARALGLAPPFTNDPLGWRKAKESYKTTKNIEDKKPTDT